MPPTTAVINAQGKSPGNLSGLPLDPAVNAGAINSGDLCYWTGVGVASFGTGLTLTAALLAKLQRILGVARDTNPLTAGGIVNPIETIGIDQSGKFLFNTTAADVYTPFAEVTLGADAQTIALAPVGPTQATTSVAGADGAWTAGAHTVQAAYLTANGETPLGIAGTATVVGANHITTVAVAPPAWALGVVYYVDGVFAGFSASGASINLLAPSATPRIAVAQSSIAIGRVFIPQTNISPAVAAPTSITGAAGTKIQVILYKPWPQSLAL